MKNVNLGRNGSLYKANVLRKLEETKDSAQAYV